MCQNIFLSEVKNLDFRLKNGLSFLLKCCSSVLYICTQRFAVCFRAALGIAYLSADGDLAGIAHLDARATSRLKHTACYGHAFFFCHESQNGFQWEKGMHCFGLMVIRF